MKTIKSRVRSMVILLLVCILLLTALCVTNGTKNAQIENKEAIVRTASLTAKDIYDKNLEDEFDQYDVYSTDTGLDIVAKKNFNTDILRELDLISIDEAEEFTVRYEIQYIENEDTVLLCAIIEGKEDIPVIDTIPGLVTYNGDGEADILFSIEGEKIWLSELNESETINEIGWFSSLFRSIVSAVKNAANNIKKAVETILAPVKKIAKNITVKLLAPKAAAVGAYFLNMSQDEQGIYHADFDCWQQYFGYCDFYDKVFKTFTCMERKKFPYSYDANGDGETEDFILWAWKGDYLNLGAGAELGVYKKWAYDSDLWIVDKSQAMKMTLKLTKNNITIFDYRPTEKQWWITGFNYKYHTTQYELDRDITKAYYTITFNNYTSYKAFKTYNSRMGSTDSENDRWVNTSGYTFSFVL